MPRRPGRYGLTYDASTEVTSTTRVMQVPLSLVVSAMDAGPAASHVPASLSLTDAVVASARVGRAGGAEKCGPRAKNFDSKET
jgi:hypothetical protein